MTTTGVKTRFGAHALQPDGLRAAYGGRWIVKQDGYTDLVWDRHGVEGEDVEALLDWLNEPRGEGALQKAREKASELLKRRTIRTNEQSPIVLYQDRKGAVVADTNGSYGYLYVTGWLYSDMPEDRTTNGLEKVTEAMRALL